jgi:large subunit ribosomal protein L14e
MGDAEISTSQWRLVEVGRVVTFKDGEYDGRLAAIVEIIDHKRVRKLRHAYGSSLLTAC